MVWLEQGGKAGRRGDGGKRSLAWRGVVVEEYAILAGKLLEGNGYEGANAAYYEDLASLAVQLAVMANPIFM